MVTVKVSPAFTTEEASAVKVTSLAGAASAADTPKERTKINCTMKSKSKPFLLFII
jgi:hypothetical protein